MTRAAGALAAMLVVLGLAFGTAQETKAGFFVCGDPTNDGVVNSLDALLVLQVNAGLLMLPLPAIGVADVDNNGSVTARDASLILQYSAGLIESLNACFDKPP
jgi:hypothetical protein